MGFQSLFLGGGWSVPAFLQKIAARAGATEVVVAKTSEINHEIRGRLSRIHWRIVMSEVGELEEFELKYEGRYLELFDLNHDPVLLLEPPEARDDKEKRVFLAPALFTRGSAAEREAAAFRALPTDLQGRVLEAMRSAGVGCLRSRRDDLSVLFLNSKARERPEPVERLGSLLAVCCELTAHRLSAMKEPEPEPPPRSRPQVTDTPHWSQLVARARACAAEVGGRATERINDAAIDVEWVASGAPVELSLDAEHDDLDVFASAQGVKGAFNLSRQLGDASKTPGEERVYLSPFVFLQGDADEIAPQAALLGALPPAVLEELLGVMNTHNLAEVDLDAETLQANLGDLDGFRERSAALAVARVLGKVAGALPRGELTPALAPTKPCAACQATTLPKPGSTSCVRCGAPA